MRIKNHDEFLNVVQTLTENDYTILSEFKNMSTKVKIRHNKCKDLDSFEYEVTPSNFVLGKRCPNCNGKILNNEHFIAKVYAMVGNEYTFLEPYNGTKTKLRIRHNECNYEYYVDPNSFLSKKTRCTNEKCLFERMSKKQKEIKTKNPSIPRKNNEVFVKEVYEQVGNEYIFLESYIKNDIKLKIKHNICNNEYYVTPVAFLSNKRRCPFCSKTIKRSKNDILIEKFLIFNNFNYEKEKSFNDCRNKRNRLLYFDYLIKSNTGFFLLEYDGLQHKIGWKNNKIDLENKQHNDFTKNQYCALNKIALIRINECTQKQLIKRLNELFKTSTTIENLKILSLDK